MRVFKAAATATVRVYGVRISEITMQSISYYELFKSKGTRTHFNVLGQEIL